jgi:signal transduction histidine kinase
VAARAGDVRGEMSGEEVLRTGRTMCIDEARPGGGGPAVLAPLAADGAVLGVLAVAVAPEHGPFDAADRATIESFATEAAIAMALAAGRADRARLNVLEDRERIAADLHDRVIQRLFATGMGLQATAGRIGDEVVARRVEVAVGELDETITELRSAIFHLSERPEAEPFGERIHALAERYGAQLGFDPAVRLSGDVDDLPGAVLEQLVPTLEEALSNVARHARASAVTVELAVDDAEACLLVRDDGIGIGADAVPGTGLKTLRARAERLGGRCLVEAAPGGGTTVTWRVPL